MCCTCYSYADIKKNIWRKRCRCKCVIAGFVIILLWMKLTDTIFDRKNVNAYESFNQIIRIECSNIINIFNFISIQYWTYSQPQHCERTREQLCFPVFVAADFLACCVRGNICNARKQVIKWNTSDDATDTRPLLQTRKPRQRSHKWFIVSRTWYHHPAMSLPTATEQHRNAHLLRGNYLRLR